MARADLLGWGGSGRDRIITLSCVLGLLLSTAPVVAQESGTAVPDESADGGIQVTAAAICTSVEDRQPVGEAESFSSDTPVLYCWTRIEGGEGKTVIHAWIHAGVTRARVELRVGSNRWRTWSSKLLLPEWTGQWEVKILTPDGVVLKSLPFTIE